MPANEGIASVDSDGGFRSGKLVADLGFATGSVDCEASSLFSLLLWSSDSADSKYERSALVNSGSGTIKYY